MKPYHSGVGYDQRLQRLALDLYASGKSCRKTAACLRVSHPDVLTPSQQTIYLWAKEAKILRNKSRADEIAQRDRFGIDYDAIRDAAQRLATEKNWSVRQIAVHLGVSRNVIKRVVAPDTSSDATRRRHNLADLPDVDKRREDMVYAATRVAEGVTVAAIARALGRPYATVYSWLRGCSEADDL